LKLANCLHGKATYVFLTTIFKASLLPYLRLATAGLKKNTLIEHKKTIVVCEESGHVSLNYNVLLTTPHANVVVKPVIPFVIIKSTFTCSNCGKTSQLVETCHKKKKVLVVPPTTVKFTKLIIGTKTQPIKLGKIFACYPCIICFNIEYRFGKWPKKIEVQNMFRIKLVSSNATTTPKSFKTDNVQVNVVTVVTIHSQQSKQ
jgi:hypothetical protein